MIGGFAAMGVCSVGITVAFSLQARARAYTCMLLLFGLLLDCFFFLSRPFGVTGPEHMCEGDLNAGPYHLGGGGGSALPKGISGACTVMCGLKKKKSRSRREVIWTAPRDEAQLHRRPGTSFISCDVGVWGLEKDKWRLLYLGGDGGGSVREHLSASLAGGARSSAVPPK